MTAVLLGDMTNGFEYFGDPFYDAVKHSGRTAPASTTG